METFDETVNNVLSNPMMGIFPEEGDFSFLINKNQIKSISYEYELFFKIIKTPSLLTGFKNFNTTFWKTMLEIHCYKFNTDEFFYKNILIFECIVIFGWCDFVIIYLNYCNKKK
jgi:hypothetical protein